MTTNDSRRSADLPPPPASSLPLSGDHLGHQQQMAHNAGGHGDHAAHGGHGWMMIVCCIPMLAIAVLLVATGAASVGFLGVAIGCTLMMVLMMRAMDSSGHNDHGPGR